MHWVEQQIWTRGAEKEKDTKRAKVTQRGENKDGHWRNSLGYDWILLPHFLRPLTSVSHIYSSLGLDSIDPATYFLPARTHTHTHTRAHTCTNKHKDWVHTFIFSPCTVCSFLHWTQRFCRPLPRSDTDTTLSEFSMTKNTCTPTHTHTHRPQHVHAHALWLTN